MASAERAPAADEDGTAEKRTWVTPSVVEIDVGEAEGADGVGTDGGLIS